MSFCLFGKASPLRNFAISLAFIEVFLPIVLHYKHFVGRIGESGLLVLQM